MDWMPNKCMDKHNIYNLRLFLRGENIVLFYSKI